MGKENITRIGHLAIRDRNENDRLDAGDQVYWVRYEKGRPVSAVRIDDKKGGMELARREMARIGISTPLDRARSLRGVERFADSLLGALSLRRQCRSNSTVKPVLADALSAARDNGIQLDTSQLRVLMDGAAEICKKDIDSMLAGLKNQEKF